MQMQKDNIKDWDNFLSNIENRCDLTTMHADWSRLLWNKLKQTNKNLPLPIVSKTTEGNLQFAWSYSNFLLEIDISNSGDIYWFAKNRSSNIYEDGLFRIYDEFPLQFKLWLIHVIEIN
jgi:hypothetical protein